MCLCYCYKIESSFIVVSTTIDKIIAMKILNSNSNNSDL